MYMSLRLTPTEMCLSFVISVWSPMLNFVIYISTYSVSLQLKSFNHLIVISSLNLNVKFDFLQNIIKVC